MSAPTRMFTEAEAASEAVARFLARNTPALQALGLHLRQREPVFVTTCARGSSDHAATYGKYLIETRLGVPTASVAMSVASLYDAPVRPANSLCIAISQSGRSPDLLAAVEAQKRSGALVVALVNDESAPLANLADVVLGLSAGPETSVAATKSYIASLAALAAITAHWSDDSGLIRALDQLPEQLADAFRLDWSPAAASLESARNLFVIGRGYGLAIAQEAALKLKETCGLHAEAISSAEVRHGPMAIVKAGFPLLAFATSDIIGQGVAEVAAEFAGRGAKVHLCGAGGDLPTLRAAPVLEPLLMIQSFYRFVEALSRRRGYDPDSPPHLSKVTQTL